MLRRMFKAALCWVLAGACLMQFQGCVFEDPDVRLQAGLTFGSDLAIFLLENAARGGGL